VLLWAAIKYLNLTYRGQVLGFLIGGIFLTILGIQGIFGTDFWWIILIAIGIGLIVFGISGRKNIPKP
jgi:hypothetical protein